MQQQSDHFGSNGPDEIGNGNNNLFGNSKPQELVFLNSLNISNYGEPTSWNGPWSNTNLENIRDKTFPYAIRATAGLLFWFANEVDLITNIEEAQVIFPIDLILHQNYPNPFNPNTVISYQLPVSSDVTLKIYDVLGNEVATLVDDYKLAGSYEVEFNASTLPSGVYFYQLRTRGPEINSGQGIVETKKMILLK
ncbi:MAG: T9SS type A sorting domain-containing protein [Ignavibacteriota bacterium]|nr:MAG: T9SS C-terminal target domain-containing protein [Chlorobiota bacterium]MBE7475270.1 T9SS type A sorting domain-containing protein [Ignavibacteriales bacterium]MBL1122237.1 T9SS C-terminal target domain-containing protein [Ignavibacteriota bacterium]MCC7093256.1 T9SS type A sorting domain-containing protein [Ignavibacteriaceae bacterium]MCE7855392.1 T9SS C-terminal target domain-containing protein [Ignavibacteria bacterium CHB3]